MAEKRAEAVTRIAVAGFQHEASTFGATKAGRTEFS